MIEAMTYLVDEARALASLPGHCRIEGQGKDARVVTARSCYLAATDVARKAVPFVHPTLASVEHKNKHSYEATLLELIREEERTRVN